MEIGNQNHDDQHLTLLTDTRWCDSVTDWCTGIDLQLPFVCPSLTPLFYSPVYRQLSAAQQQRYNQLSAISFLDLILFFEQSFEASLLSLVSNPAKGTAALNAEIVDFRDDERRHCQMWRRLSSMSLPKTRTNEDYKIFRVRFPFRFMLGNLASRPTVFPVTVLLMLALEEHSIEISRRCARLTQGELEPHYRDAFAAHLLDEARHVRIDQTLLRMLIDPLSPGLRRLNALIFHQFIRRLWLRPARAASRVIDSLVLEFAELQPIRHQLAAGLIEAENNSAYRDMMLSRRSAPLLFGIMADYPEFCPREMMTKPETFSEGART